MRNKVISPHLKDLAGLIIRDCCGTAAKIASALGATPVAKMPASQIIMPCQNWPDDVWLITGASP